MDPLSKHKFYMKKKHDVAFSVVSSKVSKPFDDQRLNNNNNRVHDMTALQKKNKKKHFFRKGTETCLYTEKINK